jgi:hypothetical protein
MHPQSAPLLRELGRDPPAAVHVRDPVLSVLDRETWSRREELVCVDLKDNQRRGKPKYKLDGADAGINGPFALAHYIPYIAPYDLLVPPKSHLYLHGLSRDFLDLFFGGADVLGVHLLSADIWKKIRDDLGNILLNCDFARGVSIPVLNPRLKYGTDLKTGRTFEEEKLFMLVVMPFLIRHVDKEHLLYRMFDKLYKVLSFVFEATDAPMEKRRPQAESADVALAEYAVLAQDNFPVQLCKPNLHFACCTMRMTFLRRGGLTDELFIERGFSWMRTVAPNPPATKSEAYIANQFLLFFAMRWLSYTDSDPVIRQRAADIVTPRSSRDREYFNVPPEGAPRRHLWDLGREPDGTRLLGEGVPFDRYDWASNNDMEEVWDKIMNEAITAELKGCPGLKEALETARAQGRVFVHRGCMVGNNEPVYGSHRALNLRHSYFVTIDYDRENEELSVGTGGMKTAVEWLAEVALFVRVEFDPPLHFIGEGGEARTVPTFRVAILDHIYGHSKDHGMPHLPYRDVVECAPGLFSVLHLKDAPRRGIVAYPAYSICEKVVVLYPYEGKKALGTESNKQKQAADETFFVKYTTKSYRIGK